MNDTFDLRISESHIEVHKFHGGTILLSVIFALVLQAFLPVYITKASILDLPLLITIYFGLSRRNPSTGLLLGTFIGLLQDSLSKTPIGLFGIAKTVIGYLASSIGARLDTEHPLARFALTATFFAAHQGIVVLVQKLLLAQPQPWFTTRLLVACIVNAILGVFLYHFLDRLRKS
jgi:rod shape-determining protein MreD